MNKYDNYVGFDYIPVPFEQYAKAGDMQQGKYDQAQEQLQKVQDALAALPSKQADIAGKNALLNKFISESAPILENQTYNPNMGQQVRQMARKWANSPEVQTISKHYQLEQEHRKLRDNLKAQGKLWEYDTSLFDKPSVSAEGVLTDYGRQNDITPGFEQSLDHVEAADRIVQQLQPFVKDLGAHITYQNVKDPQTGEVRKVPYLTDSKVSQLLTKDPRVQKFIKDNIPSFLSDAAGSQFSRMKQHEFDTQGKENYDTYFNKINPDTNQPYTKEEVKQIYAKDAVSKFLESRIKEVSIRDDQNKPMSKAEMLALGFGSSTPDRQNEGMPFFNAMSGIGYNANQGAADAVVNVNTPIQAIELSDSEIQNATKSAENKFNKYIQDNKGKIQRDLDAGRPVNPVLKKMYDFLNRNNEEESKNLKQEFIQKELNSIKESKKAKLLQNQESSYTPSQWSTDAKTASYFKNKFNMITPNDAKLANATGKSIGGTLEQILADSDLTMEDLQQNAEFVRVRTSKSPEGYATNSAEYSVYLPEDLAEKVRKINKDVYDKSLVKDKQTGLYKINIATPVWELYDASSEMGLQKELGLVDDKNPQFYERNKQVADAVKTANDKNVLTNFWQSALDGKVVSTGGDVKINKQRGTLIIPVKDPQTGKIYQQELDPQMALIYERIGQLELGFKQ